MHLGVTLLSIILLVLAAAIIAICVSFLLRNGRKPAASHARAVQFEDVLRAVEAMPLESEGIRPLEDGTKQDPAGFVSRHHSTQAHPQETVIDTHRASTTPEKIAFHAIKDEIRAALGQATQSAAPPPPPASPTLNWTETGRLAVLSLRTASPQTAWPLLQAHGIHILIVPQGHPFPATSRMIELIFLSSYNDASMPELVAKLRAKLAKGERIAFYTETGLSGAGAFLAARLSGRSAS